MNHILFHSMPSIHPEPSLHLALIYARGLCLQRIPNTWAIYFRPYYSPYSTPYCLLRIWHGLIWQLYCDAKAVIPHNHSTSGTVLIEITNTAKNIPFRISSKKTLSSWRILSEMYGRRRQPPSCHDTINAAQSCECMRRHSLATATRYEWSLIYLCHANKSISIRSSSGF